MMFVRGVEKRKIHVLIEPYSVVKLLTPESHMKKLCKILFNRNPRYLNSQCFINTSMQSFCFAFPEAIISPSILDIISITCQAIVYTDGSCLHPNMISVRYAAYAIVVDWAQSDLQREFEANKFLHTGEMPQTLQVIATARVTGEQNIARAELFALVMCFEYINNFTLFTDSA